MKIPTHAVRPFQAQALLSWAVGLCHVASGPFHGAGLSLQEALKVRLECYLFHAYLCIAYVEWALKISGRLWQPQLGLRSPDC